MEPEAETFLSMTRNPPMVQRLDAQSFDSEVLAANVPVLVDFTAAWCSPCRALAPVLDRLAAESAGKLKILSVDAGENAGLCAEHGVRAFPTVIAFSGGAEVGRHVGFTSAAKLLALLG
jgi:thioredoxin 1